MQRSQDQAGPGKQPEAVLGGCLFSVVLGWTPGPPAGSAGTYSAAEPCVALVGTSVPLCLLNELSSLPNVWVGTLVSVKPSSLVLFFISCVCTCVYRSVCV